MRHDVSLSLDVLDALSASVETGWIILVAIIPLFPNGHECLMFWFNPSTLLQDLNGQLPRAFGLVKASKAYAISSIEISLM